jgi:hypothetical protein
MPGPKENNRQVYPDANHQPRQKAAERLALAQDRQKINDGLTLEQKIAKLPPEPYSKKERARLLSALAKRNAPKPEPKNETPKQETSGSETVVKEQPKPKKYMKGSK